VTHSRERGGEASGSTGATPPETWVRHLQGGGRQRGGGRAGGTAGIADPVAETVLAHVQKEAVRRAYLTSDFFEYRVPVMQEWADFIAETMGPVVPT